MSLPHATVAQTDFSAGQIDLDLKRSDEPVARAGARQMTNFRILNSKRIKDRPGRRVFYAGDGRVDQLRLDSGNTYDICFRADGGMTMRDSNGTVLAASAAGAYPWNASTVHLVNWCLVNVSTTDRDIVICFPGMQPQLARLVGGLAWGFFPFSFPALSSGGISAPFYRLAQSGVTLRPSTIVGAITLVSNLPTFQPGMVGTYIKWLGSQIVLTGYTNSTTMSATVLQQLPYSKNLHTASGQVNGYFSPGDIVQGTLTGYQAEVVAWDPATQNLVVNMLKSGLLFAGINGAAGSSPEGDTIVGPNGSIVPTNVNPLTLTPTSPIAQASLLWSELAVSQFRGWPRSCFFDQGRLGFTDIPALPRAILWCAQNQFYAFDVGLGQPTDAIFELMAETSRIYHVVPGDGGEMVFADVGAFYIPINENNPLKPGSVSFRPISPEGAAPVRPVRVAEGMLYVNSGANRVTLIAGSGSTASVKPYSTLDITAFHSSLFDDIKAIAVTQGDDNTSERYVYVLSATGQVVVGRLDVSKGWMGWTPWSSSGTPNWLSALQSVLTFTTIYNTPGGSFSLVERLDETQYMDASVAVNGMPATLAPPSGKGPLWYMAGATVSLMDQGTRYMGLYQVDADGFIVPQYVGAEDMASAQLTAGFSWSATYEPFIPQNASGQTVGQRMKRRKLARWAVSALHKTGFVVGDTRISPYRMGDDATLPAPTREETITGRQQGRDFDPRLIVVKDTPGPFTLIEAGAEVTV